MRKWMRFAAWALASALLVGGACAAQLASGAREVEIQLAPGGSAAGGAGVEIDGDTVRVRAAGTYRVRGALADGQLVVAVNKDARVTLILDGAEISNADDAAILVEDAGLVTIELAEGSVNRVRSGEPAEISAETADAEASGGAIRAKDDLTIAGAGALEVLGYVNNGIHCSNRLRIEGGEISVEAVNNGVKGKDGVTVAGGSLRIHSGGDGVEADSQDGDGFGVIEFAGGEVDIESCGDGAQAETELTVSGGALTVASGGGSAAAAPQGEAFPGRWNRGGAQDLDEVEDAPSAKGLKAGELLAIRGGSVNIDAADDALHTDGALVIAGGALTLASGDDGAHADDALTVSDGTLVISESYEGIEANQILITGGDIDVTASDDGINANGGASAFGGFGMRGDFGGMRGRGGFRGGAEAQEGAEPPAGASGEPSEDMERPAGMPENMEPPAGMGAEAPQDAELPATFAHELPQGAGAEDSAGPLPLLRITGGTLHVDAGGDGLDSNGDLAIEGGFIVVDGPDNSGNGALDSGAESGGSCRVDGGTVLAVGASGMAESFDAASGQCSFAHNFAEVIPAGSEIRVTDAAGKVLIEHTAVRSFSSVVFSCPEMEIGESYTLTAGEERAEIALEDTVTQSGEAGRGWQRQRASEVPWTKSAPAERDS